MVWIAGAVVGVRSGLISEALLSALSARDLDSRLVEALPWVLLNYPELDWQWLMSAARAHDLQKERATRRN